MDNTNEQEATDGAQAHRAKLNVASSEYGVPADLIHGDTEDEIKEIPTTCIHSLKQSQANDVRNQ